MQVNTITAEEYADIVKFMSIKCARLCSKSESSEDFYNRYDRLLEGALRNARVVDDVHPGSLIGKLAVVRLTGSRIKTYKILEVDEGTSTYFWRLDRYANHPIITASEKILAVIV